jgi:hypothetical protein
MIGCIPFGFIGLAAVAAGALSLPAAISRAALRRRRQ